MKSSTRIFSAPIIASIYAGRCRRIRAKNPKAISPSRRAAIWCIGATGWCSQVALSDRLLYGIEAAYEGGYGLSTSYQQSGARLSGIPQHADAIHAFGGDFRLDYLLGDEHQTRLSMEGIIASGDSDPLT